MLTKRERDGCRPNGTARRTSRRIASSRKPSPGDTAGEAKHVEQRRIVLGAARRQNVGLPRLRRNLDAVELLQDARQALEA